MNRILPVLFLLVLTACMPALPASEPTEALTQVPASTPSPEIIDTEIVPATEMPLGFLPEDPANVVLDFTADLCSAEWSNSGEYLACPGDPGDTAAGYSTILESTALSDGTMIESPSLLMIPPHGSRFGGLFGAYPELNIYPGDHFKAVLACQWSEPDCDISYALHYFDENGNFQQVSTDLGPKPISNHSPVSDRWTEVDIDLSYLAGYTVRLVLTVRTEGEPLAYPALWIAPHIQRQPDAQPAPVPVLPTASSATDENSQEPGVISGRVDLSSAPPYLTDPGTGGSMPVVVMFFNLDDSTWWWIHSTLTHPYFEMTAPAGRHHVVAYAQGVGDVPYVTGGYTGANPSCGQELQVVNVPGGTTVEDIVIADWNWTCGGTAYRPEKPVQVPLP
jgi:hypothetical protein